MSEHREIPSDERSPALGHRDIPLNERSPNLGHRDIPTHERSPASGHRDIPLNERSPALGRRDIPSHDRSQDLRHRAILSSPETLRPREIPLHERSPVLRRTIGGSVRSYDARVMELLSEADDDDGGFKSMPDYALSRIFSIPHGHDEDSLTSGSVQSVQSVQSIPAIMMTPGSPEVIVRRKKRRAPDPPVHLSLIDARNRFPSSDDIVERRKSIERLRRDRDTFTLRPVSFSDGTPPKKSVALWDELLDKLYKSPSPSPGSSPRVSRARTFMQKIRSPRTVRMLSKKRTDKISRLEEEAGFKPLSLSNSSSFDETDGPEIVIHFAIIGYDLDRDVEFEVMYMIRVVQRES